MSILIDKNTKVVVQGITGRDGAFHTRQMLDYGTKIVAGVTPGKAGEKVEIREGGKCRGDIFTPTIALSENGYFEGNVNMGMKDREPTVLHFIEKRKY